MDCRAERYVQVSEYYRRATEGHVHIRETLDALFDRLGERMQHLRPDARVLELGSHAGIISERLLQTWPNLRLVVHDEDEELVAMSRQRLAGKPIEYHTTSLAGLSEPVQLVLSIARHHHLPHDYLTTLRGVMAGTATYVVGDELCPEYCAGEHRQLINHAEVIHMAGGYVLTSHADVAAFRENGTLPEYSLQMEELRRRALWRWYRFVVDCAVDDGYFDVAAGELRSAGDDLVTGSDAEHKFSPSIVERQFALAGFRQLSKRSIGSPDEPERQSMFIYEYGLD
jgi:hypothetical protein